MVNTAIFLLDAYRPYALMSLIWLAVFYSKGINFRLPIDSVGAISPNHNEQPILSGPGEMLRAGGSARGSRIDQNDARAGLITQDEHFDW